MTSTLAGFSEAVLRVSDLGPWEQLADYAAWPTEILEDAQGNRQLLCTRPDGQGIHLRAIEVQGAAANPRQGVDSWSTGGHFDLNLRSHNVTADHAALIAMGWRALNPPVPWQFGPSSVTEVILEGPDGIVVAFMQRHAPPLEGWQFERLSHVFNASQIVCELDSGIRFFETLGFREVISHYGALPDGGGRVLGLGESADRTAVNICVMQGEGEMLGSIELVQIARQGEDLASAHGADQLGIDCLSFPVADIAAYSRQLTANGLEIGEPAMERWPGTGTVLALRLATPEAARLCFYQPIG